MSWWWTGSEKKFVFGGGVMHAPMGSGNVEMAGHEIGQKIG